MQSPKLNSIVALVTKILITPTENDSILDNEDVLWRQKSMISWLQSSDQNTKFFHLTTLIRRREIGWKGLKMIKVIG